MRQQLRPLFDQIVVKELDPPEVRESGLALPPSARQESQWPQHGIVIAVGGGIDWWESVGFKMPVDPGDHVAFPAHAGVHVEVNEEKLLVLRVGQLLGVVEDVREPKGTVPLPGERADGSTEA